MTDKRDWEMPADWQIERIIQSAQRVKRLIELKAPLELMENEAQIIEKYLALYRAALTKGHTCQRDDQRGLES